MLNGSWSFADANTTPAGRRTARRSRRFASIGRLLPAALSPQELPAPSTLNRRTALTLMREAAVNLCFLALSFHERCRADACVDPGRGKPRPYSARCVAASPRAALASLLRTRSRPCHRDPRLSGRGALFIGRTKPRVGAPCTVCAAPLCGALDRTKCRGPSS